MINSVIWHLEYRGFVLLFLCGTSTDFRGDRPVPPCLMVELKWGSLVVADNCVQILDDNLLCIATYACLKSRFDAGDVGTCQIMIVINANLNTPYLNSMLGVELGKM